MFHTIRQPIQERMQFLEKIDARDRNDGTPRMRRLRQIPPDTGKFLALLAASAPQGKFLEIGTSAGYSTLWIALACEMSGRSVTTFEILRDKAKLARETFQAAGVNGTVHLVEGDALQHISQHDQIAFCFLDAEKEIYGSCYEAVIPRMVNGGILVADNATNHYDTLKPVLERALTDERVDALVLPFDNGVLVCRKI